MSECGLQEIPDGHCRQAILSLPRFESDEVRLGQMNLSGVLNQKDPIILRYEFSEDVEHRRFAGPGSAANEDVFPNEDIVLESVCKIVVECSGSDQIVH